MAGVVRDKDKGMARLLAQLRKRGARVKIGVPDEPRDEGGPSNLDVAIWNEFGTSLIPERSFIRATYDGDRDRIHVAMRKLGRLSVRKGASHEALLQAFGAWLVALVRKRITDGIPPANKQSTIDRKGSSKPLIDTGQLIKSIQAQVLK